ncbi:MAG TPA: sugar ABC transporter permease [Thermomicrobiales bacterium]|nr:sugar ABC transporter permease [Thermomicrobiales bacterium]
MATLGTSLETDEREFEPPRQATALGGGIPWWERHLAWLLVAPTILLLVVFAVVPTIMLVRFAFSQVLLQRGGIQTRGVGFDNFARALQDPLVHDSIGITLRWVAVVTTLEVLLGLGLALLLAGNVRGRGLFASLLIIPIIMPPVAVSVAFYFAYDYTFGVFNYLLGQIGVDPVRWLSDPAIAIYSMMAVDVWQATPFVFLLLYAAILSLPRDPYEAAAIDGAGRWHVFRTVTLPLLGPVLLVVVLLRLIDAARAFDKIYVMTRGGPGTSAFTATLTIYNEAFAKFDFGYASALSFMFQIVMIVFGSIYVKRALADYSAPAE